MGQQRLASGMTSNGSTRLEHYAPWYRRVPDLRCKAGFRELTISDPEGRVGSDVLLDALQELRDAGAEAVEVSTVDGPAVRVVAGTSFVDADPGARDRSGGVEVDGTVLVSPYRFRVIGEPRTLAAALDIPGGVLDVLSQRGAQGVVTQRQALEITSLRAAPSPRYARPAEEGDGG